MRYMTAGEKPGRPSRPSWTACRRASRFRRQISNDLARRQSGWRGGLSHRTRPRVRHRRGALRAPSGRPWRSPWPTAIGKTGRIAWRRSAMCRPTWCAGVPASRSRRSRGRPQNEYRRLQHSRARERPRDGGASPAAGIAREFLAELGVGSLLYVASIGGASSTRRSVLAAPDYKPLDIESFPTCAVRREEATEGRDRHAREVGKPGRHVPRRGHGPLARRERLRRRASA